MEFSVNRPCKRGSELHPDDQKYVLSAFVHRHTRDHKPEWAKAEWKDGKPYPVQFVSDQEWLEHTEFNVSKTNGRIDQRVKSCLSYPTWPDNPELRR